MKGSQSSDKQGKGRDVKSSEKKSKQSLARKSKQQTVGNGKAKAGRCHGGKEEKPEKQPQEIKALKSGEKLSKN